MKRNIFPLQHLRMPCSTRFVEPHGKVGVTQTKEQVKGALMPSFPSLCAIRKVKCPGLGHFIRPFRGCACGPHHPGGNTGSWVLVRIKETSSWHVLPSSSEISEASSPGEGAGELRKSQQHGKGSDSEEPCRLLRACGLWVPPAQVPGRGCLYPWLCPQVTGWRPEPSHQQDCSDADASDWLRDSSGTPYSPPCNKRPVPKAEAPMSGRESLCFLRASSRGRWGLIWPGLA